MNKIAKVKFPSANIPGADLRLYQNTIYTFECLNCNKKISIVLEEIQKKEISWRSDFTPILVEQLTKEYGYDGMFSVIKCNGCKSEYFLQIEFTETSMGAYRAEILNAGKLINDNPSLESSAVL